MKEELMFRLTLFYFQLKHALKGFFSYFNHRMQKFQMVTESVEGYRVLQIRHMSGLILKEDIAFMHNQNK